jgi:hypothetical protein
MRLSAKAKESGGKAPHSKWPMECGAYRRFPLAIASRMAAVFEARLLVFFVFVFVEMLFRQVVQ